MQPWHEKFKTYRTASGWSLTDAAHELVATGLYAPDQLDAARTNVLRWERGDVKSPRREARRAIAKMFDRPEADFFPSRPLAQEKTPIRPAPEDWADMLDQLRAGDSSRLALERSAIEVDRVCSEYASLPAPLVLADVHQLGTALIGLRPTINLAGHSELYRQLAWLSMLRACLLYDTNDEAGAHVARKQGMILADELGDPRISAWGDEIASWIALTKGDMSQTIRAAQAGIDKSPTSDVAAQLWAQQAKAYSRLQDRHKTEVALEKVRIILDSVTMPDNMRNHFAVDPTKATFYAMDANRVVGNDPLATALADTVIATSTTPDGDIISPMRLAEALLTKAVITARSGELGVSSNLAMQAMNIERQSAPSLVMVAREVAREMRKFDISESEDFAQSIKEVAGV